MNYLITGGNGNLARQLAAHLTANHKVILHDQVPPVPDKALMGATFLTGDITNDEEVRSILETYRPDCIYHMASLLSGSSEVDRRRAWAVNATAGFELLEIAMECGVKRFFFPSTIATYGAGAADPLPEDFPQWPENLYGATKVAMERLGCYYYFKHGLDFRSVRLPFVISRHAPAGALTAYASQAFVKAASKQKMVFPVEPHATVSTIYVKDVIAGILRLMEAPAEKLTRRVYNLHGFAPPASDIANAIKARVPDFEYTFVPHADAVRLTRALPAVMNDGAARSDWGWSPRFDLDKTADDFLEDLSHP